MYRFDMQGLQDTLDGERQTRNLSWVELAAEINLPFKQSTSIPINVATIRNMSKKRSVASAVVLQVLRWLNRTPESFLRGGVTVCASNALPDPGPKQTIRIDTIALFAAINMERQKRGLTWQEVASELSGYTKSMFASFAKGSLIGLPQVKVITQWLGHPVADFVRRYSR